MAITAPKANGEREGRRDSVINLRVPSATRDLIDSAAAALGKTRTEFVLESARQSAADVLLDRRLLSLDAAAFGAFMDVLDSPPAPTEKLRRLMKRRTPWGR